MKISVVVPTFNEEKYIDSCINSFKNQSFSNFELIAVDKSRDDTPRICEKNGWKIVKQMSKGVSLARAEGFAEASGEVIASTDADTAVDQKWLEEIAQSFKDPKVVCAYGPVYLSDGPAIYKILAPIFLKIFIHWNRLIRKDHIMGMNFAVRKDAYNKIGGFRADLWTAEDVDLGLRIRKEGKVLYNKNMKVYTSSRRLLNKGLFKFLKHHITNYLRMYIKGKSSNDFEPIR